MDIGMPGDVFMNIQRVNSLAQEKYKKLQILQPVGCRIVSHTGIYRQITA